MPDMLATGSAWLKGRLQSHAAQAVTIARGSQAIGVDVRATYGNTMFEQDSETGIVRWESKDFLIPADAYTLGGSPVEPQRGDRITDAAGNVFEALGNAGEPPFRYTDGFRSMLRIHTKQVL